MPLAVTFCEPDLWHGYRQVWREPGGQRRGDPDALRLSWVGATYIAGATRWRDSRQL